MRTAIVVITLGERPWFGYALHWLNHFCDRFGFDIIVYRQPLIENIRASSFQTFGRCQKLGIGHLFDQYDCIIQVDDTCLISPVSQNIVNLVPRDAIGCYVEGEDHKRYARYQLSHQAAYGRSTPLPLDRFYNNGMAIYFRSHARLFDQQAIPWDVVLSDPMFPTGGYLSHRADVLGYGLHDLGMKYNYPGSMINQLETIETNEIYVFHLTSFFSMAQRMQYARKIHQHFTNQFRRIEC